MSATQHVSMTELLRSPKSVVEDVLDGDVVIDRRDGPSLRLSINERFEDTAANLLAASTMLRSIAANPVMAEAMALALVEMYPWINALPKTDRSACVSELLEALVTSLQLDRWGAFEQRLHEWTNTARIWTNPKLVKELLRPIDNVEGSDVAP